MAFSKIELEFVNWSSGNNLGKQVTFTVGGLARGETIVTIRSDFGQVTNSADNNTIANNYKNAWQADYAGTDYIVTILANTVTITATFDGAEFDSFFVIPGMGGGSGDVNETITNIPFAPPFSITAALVEEAATDKCTTVKVTLTAANGTPPYTWNTILPGNIGLIGANIPRTGNEIVIEVEDSLGATDTINVLIPETVDNSDIDAVVIEGDPSGLFGTVSVMMEEIEGLPITWEFSLDGVTWQTSNVFTGILVGAYTLRVRDNFGCVITEDFEVTLTTIRPPVYALIPKSNSFGWFQQQATINECTNPYNGSNTKPNDYKPLRWYNPKYFQPWCSNDSPPTQFRSNYDTLSAKLFNLVTGAEVTEYTIFKRSNNLGQRQIMDATIYKRNPTQTGVYWTDGNVYDTDRTTVIGSYNLDGQLPEWVKVGQKFSLSGSAADGIFEIKQIVFDSTLLVNAAIIDRVYTDLAEEVAVKVDAVYNRLNYEVYEFTANLNNVVEGCYRIILSMTDSLAEYPDSIWETFPFVVQDSNVDLIIMESWNHVDDGILYSTGIIHKQRFQGLFYDEDYPSNFETSRDSRKALQKQDGRVQKSMILEAIDVQQWVYEKLALFIAKKTIRINGVYVQFEEPFEKEKLNPTYTRVNLKGEAFVSGYEQYMTNTYDIL